MTDFLTDGLLLFLGLLALLSALRTVYIYARDGRNANIDLMGHSINFQFRWLIAALLTGFAVGSIASLHWVWGLVAGLGFFASTFFVRRMIAWAMQPFGWRSVLETEQTDGFKTLDLRARDLRASELDDESAEKETEEPPPE